MRKVFFGLFALAFAATSCSNNPNDGASNKNEENTAANKSEQLILKGSDTQLPITQALAEAYQKKHSGASVSVVGGGSGVGISALQDGTTDIAMSSRELKTSEKLKLNEKIDLQEAVVAIDALAVIVHTKNLVNKLTREQIEDIFTGKITNWKEVGGRDMKMIVYSRESSSGTYEFFKEHVLKKKNYANDILAMSSTGAIVTSVSQTEGAISYVGLAYIRPGANIQPVAISYDQGKTFSTASVENAKNKSYPVSRPLYYFYNGKIKEKVKGFIDFALSDEGQKIIAEVGYVPVK